jgi:hypothetical protein
MEYRKTRMRKHNTDKGKMGFSTSLFSAMVVTEYNKSFKCDSLVVTRDS